MLGLGARPALLGWGRVLVAAADFYAADFLRRILWRSFDTALPNFGPNYAILRLSPMPKIRFLEKLLAWLMRGFRRPSVIKHQTWLVSYLGYGGSYPTDYAMVLFQTSVCLASVLCYISNSS